MDERQKSGGIGWALVAGGWVAAVVVLAGCGSNPDGAMASADGPGVRGDVLNVRPAAASGRAPVVCAAPLVDTPGPIPLAPQAVTPASGIIDAPPPPPPVRPTVVTAAVAKARVHVVRRGETLFAIAKATYGDGSAWHKLADANPAAAGKALRVGQQIVVP